MKYMGLLELNPPISLADDALGQTFPALIGGQRVILHTPIVATATIDTPKFESFGHGRCRLLSEPAEANGHFRKDVNIEWGELTSSSAHGCLATVKRLFIQAGCSGNDDQACIDSIDSSLGAWLGSLDSFMRLQTAQRLHRTGWNISGPDERLSLFHAKPPRDCAEPSSTRARAIVIANKDFKNSREPFERAIDWCSHGKTVSLQYQLILRAYDALIRDDPRGSIIEAATALEVAFTRRIRLMLSGNGISAEHAEIMLRGYEMLRNRFSLSKKLGVKVSISEERLKNEVINIRNMVIHGGHFVEFQDARKLVTLVRGLLDELSAGTITDA